MQLFDTLVLPILSCACEVCAVSPSVSEAAEVGIYTGFLKQLFGVCTSTANAEIMLASLAVFLDKSIFYLSAETISLP